MDDRVQMLCLKTLTYLNSLNLTDEEIDSVIIALPAARADQLVEKQRLESERLERERNNQERLENAMRAMKVWLIESNLCEIGEWLMRHGEQWWLDAAIMNHIFEVRNLPGSFGYFSVEEQLRRYLVPDRPLTKEECERLMPDVTLIGDEAAKFLGITRKEFDKLKKQHGLKARGYRHFFRSPGRYPAYLLEDVMKLK